MWLEKQFKPTFPFYQSQISPKRLADIVKRSDLREQKSSLVELVFFEMYAFYLVCSRNQGHSYQKEKKTGKSILKTRPMKNLKNLF